MGNYFLSSHMRACMMAICLLFAAVVNAQNVTVKGSVLDTKGDPIIGATIKAEGTQTGTVTNYDGDFTISCRNGATLNVSYIGFAPKQVKAETGKVLKIVLEEEATTLNEVVVTALGIKKDQKKLGYAISSINSDELIKTGASNFASALYGKAPGVRIQAAPGGNTSAVSISVRGMSSITGNTQPLIVMDGVPIHNGNTNNEDYWSNQRIRSNGLVDINPEDIENISILKGAAASALYGSEAANGVVMITTKKAAKGTGTRVNFSANVSWDKIAYMPDMQTEFGPGYDNWVLGNDNEEALTGFRHNLVDRNGNSITTPRTAFYHYGPRYDSSKKVTYFDGTERAYEAIGGNQWNEVFRTGFNQNYNVAITNSSERSNIRFSYNFNDVKPMQYNSANHKHNFNVNGSFDITNTIKLNYTATYQKQFIKNRPYRISRLVTNYTGMFGSFTDVKYLREHTMTSLGYINSVYAANGGTANTLTPDEQFLYNPFNAGSLMSEYFWNILGKEQLEDHQRFIGSINPTWEIIPGLTLSARVATDLTSDKIENQNRAESAHIFSTNGEYNDSYSLENNKYEIIYGDVMLSFDKTFADVHNVQANFGYNARQETYYMSSVSTSKGLSQENWFNLAASVGPKSANMNKQNMLRTGMFLTASYGFDNWAYIEGTIRNEKTSTLKKGNNSFWYPSASASILFTELMKDSKPSWYDYGKIRASYGIVGNAPEIYRANLAYSQGNFQQNNGTYVYNYMSTSVGNESIKPEKKYEFEIGLESKFFNNRLGFEFSYYHNDIKDQILQTTSAYSMGAQSMLMNVGELTNSGAEFSIYGTPFMNKDWRVDLRANIAVNKNKVKKLADGLDVLSHQTWDGGAATLESHVGEPMGDFYTYTWKTDENGNRIVGADGLYIATSERQKVGNAMPDAVGGFAASVSYKNFTLDMSFDYRIGGDVINLPWQYYMDTGIIKDAVGARDYLSGGLFYYSTTDDENDKGSIVRVDPSQVTNYQRGVTKIDGHYVWDNGVIQPGVKEDGTPNDIIVTQFELNDSQYGWGTYPNQSYSEAIQKNSYVKCREISLSYQLPVEWTKRFGCSNLTVSAFARNPFYLYRTLKLFDSETTDGTNWIYQAQVGGSTASARTFGVSLRASF